MARKLEQEQVKRELTSVCERLEIVHWDDGSQGRRGRFRPEINRGLIESEPDRILLVALPPAPCDK
jgi:hypothetical protein